MSLWQKLESVGRRHKIASYICIFPNSDFPCGCGRASSHKAGFGFLLTTGASHASTFHVASDCKRPDKGPRYEMHGITATSRHRASDPIATVEYECVQQRLHGPMVAGIIAGKIVVCQVKTGVPTNRLGAAFLPPPKTGNCISMAIVAVYTGIATTRTPVR